MRARAQRPLTTARRGQASHHREILIFVCACCKSGELARFKRNSLEIYPFLCGSARVGKESLIERVRGPGHNDRWRTGENRGCYHSRRIQISSPRSSAGKTVSGAPFGQHALAGLEVEAITMIVAANLTAFEMAAVLRSASSCGHCLEKAKYFPSTNARRTWRPPRSTSFMPPAANSPTRATGI